MVLHLTPVFNDKSVLDKTDVDELYLEYLQF